MAKISGLAQIADSDISGSEDVPVLLNGKMWRARLSALAQPTIDEAAQYAGFAEEFSGPAYDTQPDGEAATVAGQFFRVPNGTTPETYTRYQRTASGSIEAAALATSVELAGPDGAARIGDESGGKLDQAIVNTSADAVGATDGPDPAGREVFAPALVTSMSDRRLYGVQLRDLVGRSYNPAYDAAQCLNGFIPEIAGDQIVIRDDYGMKLLCESPIRIQSNLRFQLLPVSEFLKGFSGNGDTQGLFSAADWSLDTDDFELIGGVLRPASITQTGKMMTIYGNRWRIVGTHFKDFHGGQGIVFGGEDIAIYGAKATTADTGVGSGPFRCIGVNGGVFANLLAEGGDDSFQFVPITVTTNARFNKDCVRASYIGCHGISHSARVIIASLDTSGVSEKAMDAVMRDLNFIGITGRAGNRAMIFENSEGDGTVDRQIDNICLQNVQIDCSQQTVGEADSDIAILSDFAGGIGRITMDNVTTRGSDRAVGMSINAEAAQIRLRECNLTSEGRVLQALDTCHIHVEGGLLELVANGGGNAPGFPVDVTAAAVNSTVEIDRTTIAGIATGKNGINVANTSTRLRVRDGTTFNKAPGANSTTGVGFGANLDTRIGETLGDVDTRAAGFYNPLETGLMGGTGKTVTVSVGVATLTHAIHSLDTEAGAATDDLTTVEFPSWARDGQIFLICPVSATRTLVLRNTGNIRFAGSAITLNDGDKYVMGVKRGNTFVIFGPGVAAAPSVTYAAPAGGATVDAEARTSLAQLAADLSDLRSKLAGAGSLAP